VVAGDNLVVYYGNKEVTTYDAKVSYLNTHKTYILFYKYIFNSSYFNNIVLHTKLLLSQKINLIFNRYKQTILVFKTLSASVHVE